MIDFPISAHHMNLAKGALVLSLVLLLNACGDSQGPGAAEGAKPDGDVAKLREQAATTFGALPDEAKSEANPITDEKVALGRMLYFDERLSRNHDVSCNSCHPLGSFGADGEPTSPGHRGERGDRNSPTVYNAAFHIAQFWDGRAADVEEQAGGPIQNPVEMAMPDGSAAQAVVRSIPGYEPLFRAAFPGDEDPVTFDNVTRAIGAFERKLVTPSRFDDFLAGDDAGLTPEERHGMSVFIQSGCTACHAGPLFGGHMYQKMGLVQPYETEDVGRKAVTGDDADLHVFKVPSLRNVAKTGPWFHDGSITTLDEAIRLMAKHQVGRELSDDDVKAIASFLGSLTGRVDETYTARPKLPPSGPDTPAPDPSDALARPPRFADATPRAPDAGPVNAREARRIVEERCGSCHRFQGKAESKYRLEGPDLMWAGQKYDHQWLVSWLMGKEQSMYPGPYRWDREGEVPLHPALVEAEAEAVADWLEKQLKVSYVREDAFDPTQLTELEIRRGGELFREYSCIGCHQVVHNGKAVGGPISTTFFDSGRRYDPDWVLAFNSDPPRFVPHSGEYFADVSERKVLWITGYIMAQGDDDFDYAEPWTGDAFQAADPERGQQVYREYCAQCHGLTGEGDGPGAKGLDPKPAAHARMAMHELPLDYLYNVVFFGGKEVGKSMSMPDWGMTLTEQQIADVIAYMQSTFRAEVAPATADGACPQPRTTQAAPAEFLAMKNTLEPTDANLEAGRKLFHETATPMACKFCHGDKGDGMGPMSSGLKPPPRNLTCSETMAGISDGQLFWIIRNGSPGTGMMAFAGLSDEQTWQLILYVRSLAP